MKWVDEIKILTTDLWSSELSKLIANAFLAQRISSINSVSALCEKTGANIHDVAIAVRDGLKNWKRFSEIRTRIWRELLQKDILNLVYICNFYGLREVADYWEKVTSINDWQQKKDYKNCY